MSSIDMKIYEINHGQSDTAALHINFHLIPEDECVTLSINNGDKFDFHLDDLRRVLEAITTFKADYS